MWRRLALTASPRLYPANISITQSLHTSSKVPTEKWDVCAGVLVERLPIVCKALNPLEQKFQELIWRVELENSLKSKHEIQHELDLRQTELLKKGELEVDLDENASKQTAQDLKDAYVEEFKQFNPSQCTTAEDQTNNLTSPNRCLKDTLYLVVEQKLGNNSYKLLPQGFRQDGESMRQTAERVLREHCGDIKVQFYGHAPCGFYKYKYPRAERKRDMGSVGAKVFFHRAIWLSDNLTKAATVKPNNKFEWLSKIALTSKITNKEYANCIQRFMM